MAVYVRFANWWPGFRAESSFMAALLKAATGQQLELVSDRHAMVDIEVHSVFTRGKSLRSQIKQYLQSRYVRSDFTSWRRLRDYGIGAKGRAHRHLWYSGENLRPPAGWDVTLSFDLDPLDGANYYLPHWAIRTGALRGADPGDMMSVGPDVFRKHRDIDEVPRKFACVLASNPHPMREQIASALSDIAEVEMYGRAFGKPVSSKYDLLKKYKFCVTPENDLYPGYVTEKPFEAWLSQTVPIWWGIDSAKFLNEHALLNLAEYDLHTLVDKVSAIEADANQWLSMVNRPIVTRQYDYHRLIDFVTERIR